jgi:putative addiction module component (TIGR02574 family)
MQNLSASDILSLPVSQRILLVEDVWDSIREVPEAVELHDSQKAELDRRLDDYHKNPGMGSPWPVVQKAIRNRK